MPIIAGEYVLVYQYKRTSCSNMPLNSSNSVMCIVINFVCETYGLKKFEIEKNHIVVTFLDVYKANNSVETVCNEVLAR